MAIYMKINGINGSVSSKGHENWIQLESFDTGLSRHISTDVGRVVSREGSVPNFFEIHLSKYADKSSPLLFSQACEGQAIPSVLIDICSTDSDLTPYSQYRLSKVIISQYHDTAFSNDHGSMENLKLNFTKIEKTYTARDENNKPTTPLTAGYDLQTASKL